VRLEDAGTRTEPAVRLRIFAANPISTTLADQVARELRWRFDLDADLGDFITSFAGDTVLGPALRRWKGMRLSCGYSLYEFLVITTALQNATVRRTTQMLDSLFERFGTRLRFDGRELYAFWLPRRLQKATEADLRALKVGYRARSLKLIAEMFVGGAVNEGALRQADREVARRELLQLYGVGPASVWYILFEVFHHYDAFDVISPWEQKIYSRLLFDREIAPQKRILSEVKRRWGAWRMLASHYIFEDLFWRHHEHPIPWLDALILR
jgi:3-methyladenine DNA glycosylase/8-oxoguanine DNA glycosylase